MPMEAEKAARMYEAEGPDKLRAYLDDLYRENFQLRLASYLSRVMLPEPHKYQNQ